MNTLVPILIRILATLALLGLVLGAYALIARPYQQRWGATPAEINRVMPGDALDPAPNFLATRAITIDGTPEQIWPWLLQMGFDRAGFYGYDILENLGSSTGMRSAESIVPELQNFRAGDSVPISKVAAMVFHEIQPRQYLVWSAQAGQCPGAFTWALYPIDAQHTRLVSRARLRFHSLAQPGLAAVDMFTEFADHLAVRKILAGVKGRVEGHSEAGWVTNLEFFFYIATFLLFAAALLLNLLRPFAWGGWLLGLAAGAGWLISWYAPLPGLIPALLELPVVIALGAAYLRR